jgi:phosphocarrier protein
VKEIQVKVSNKNGMHLRLAGELVKNTSRFSSNISIIKNGEEINAKSILSVAGLGAGYGAELKIRAEGDDEDEALNLLRKLFESGFSEGKQ